MSMRSTASESSRRGGIPRGIALTGLPLLSYGFRPFFLGAGLFAAAAMSLWLCALTLGWPVGGTAYGPAYWHGHEMLFGYAAAALAGFMLTAIPNWTGRLPVSGPPLLALVLLWLAGRVVMAAPDLLGPLVSAIVDCAFVPALAAVAAREIIAGRNWKNLKIAIVLCVLGLANIAFHLSVAQAWDTAAVFRATTGAFVMLIAIVGGRVVPSFTRNWLARSGATVLPHPFDRLDRAALVGLLLALVAWTLMPLSWITAALAAAAAVAHVVRLARWRGIAARTEPMVAVLHAAYAFVPLGMAAVALAALGWLSAVSALHLLTVGAIGNMTLAIMTRATLGHTGRPIEAGAMTVLVFVAVFVAAAIRPLAELVPDAYLAILAVSAGAWILAFLAYVFKFGPMLLQPKAAPARPKTTARRQPGRADATEQSGG